MNKKGNLNDIILIAVVVFAFSISAIIGFKIVSEFNDGAQAEIDLPANAITAQQQIENTYAGPIDTVILFLMIGVSIVTLAFAALVRVHPVFVPFFLIGLTIIIVVSGVFSNVWQAIAGEAELADVAEQLDITDFILTFLPFMIGIIGIVIMVVLYKT